MLLRKINAILSLLITFFLLDHAIFLAVWMLSKGTIPKSASFMPWILAGIVLVHALICIYFAISAHNGAENHPVKSYAKMNKSTIMQRVSGVLMIVFVPLHIAGSAGYMHPPKVVHAIVPLIFFTIVLAHVAVSTSKAFITLGIGNAKFIKAVDIIIKIICAATLIASLMGFYLYKV